MSTPATTERIFQAAIQLVSREGMLAMTIDNVAKEAGISKGGVMYHFPTKDQLVSGTLKYYAERLEGMLLRRIAEDPEPRRRWVRAMLGCLFDPPPSADSAIPNELSAETVQKFMLAVFAAAINNRGFLEPLLEVGRRLRDRLLSDPEDGLTQVLIWLAVDGLFFWEFVGMIQPGEPLYQQIGAALRELADPNNEAPALAAKRLFESRGGAE